MDWISFKDRKPEKSGMILIYSECGRGVAYYIAENIDFIRDDEFRYVFMEGRRQCPHEITHWMSLPEPPITE
jgi:hypothetical protein